MVDYGELEYLPVSRVSIVVLNWNNWPDTLECLESLLRLNYQDFRIIICDNGTTDGSLEHIRAWVEGRLDILPGDRHGGGYCGRLKNLCIWSSTIVQLPRLVAEGMPTAN